MKAMKLMEKKSTVNKILSAAKPTMPNPVSAFKQDLRYQLTSGLKNTLQREAPETLRTPKQNSFNTVANYKKAMKKYLKYGHWATI